MYNKEYISKYFIQNNKKNFTYYAIVGYDFMQEKYIMFSPNKVYHVLPDTTDGDIEKGIVCDFNDAIQILSDTISGEKETLEYILNMKNLVLNKLNRENLKNEYYHLLSRYQETKKQIKALQKSAEYYKYGERFDNIMHDIKKCEKGLRNAKKRIHFFFKEETENIIKWLDANSDILTFEHKIYNIENCIKRLEYTFRNITAFHNMYILKEQTT